MVALLMARKSLLFLIDAVYTLFEMGPRSFSAEICLD